MPYSEAGPGPMPEEHEKKTQEVNLLSDTENAVNAIAELEEYNPEYLQVTQLKKRPVPADWTGTIGEALAWLKLDKVQDWQPLDEIDQKKYEEGHLAGPRFTIYGSGGLQRYYVNKDGFVWFSLHHTRADRKGRYKDPEENPYWKKVKEKGFRLFY